MAVTLCHNKLWLWHLVITNCGCGTFLRTIITALYSWPKTLTRYVKYGLPKYAMPGCCTWRPQQTVGVALGRNKLWGIGCGTWPQQTVVTTNCRNCSCHWALTANNLCDFSNVVAFGHNKLLGMPTVPCK